MKNMNTRRWWVLGALSFGLIAVGLDMTVLNIALPTLAIELHASNSELQWFADSYNLVVAAVLLPAGMLGDRLGRKKMLLISFVMFGTASIGCAYSDSPEMLIGMRCLLGLGAAFLIPLSMSILPVLFSGNERTKATMIWATANMLGIPLGPIVGGWLLKNYHWGSVFLLNIPFVIVALIAISILLPESRSTNHSKFDGIGVLTSSVGLVALTYGVIKAGEKSWSDSGVLLYLCLGILALVGFVVWQRNTKSPLIDLSLFRSARFTWGSILATLASFTIFGLLFAIPQYFQAVGGADTLGTGLRLLPLIGGLIVGAKFADKLGIRLGAKYVVAIGFGLIALGLFIGTTTKVGSQYSFAALWITITGIGLGLALPTSMDAALGELSAERSGVGSALIMALRQVGGTIGVAILGSALNSNYRNHLDVTGLPEAVANTVKHSVAAGVAVAKQINSVKLVESVRAAFVNGMEIMLLVCGGVAVLGIILTLLFLPRKKSNGQEKSTQLESLSIDK
ncbi:DHA2 family efflux MFS transporter permease subunit [Bacillus sp. RG28]|uniref:DHA2 family efflux MFS transporter permease subunit n=1 Tax=Gottfriedia endophytica TaxID=2820819 RepID=A0A940SJ59_9BACI|nr:DHA2 family efflux MFS transporter permease subunit [Gottfriedia endophytica]MBP0725705.1 DHA2 family efflux MFS transporter permease subunit [Gottfriedia endophytica]